MRPVSAVAGTVVVVEMLEHADQPGGIETYGLIGFGLRQPRESVGRMCVPPLSKGK